MDTSTGSASARALSIPEVVIASVVVWGIFLALIIVPSVVLADSEPDIVVTETVSFDLEEFYIEPGELEVVRGTELIGVIANTGTIQHNLVLSDEVGTERLKAGETATVNYGVITGDVVLYCSIRGHREQGMEVKVTVIQG